MCAHIGMHTDPVQNPPDIHMHMHKGTWCVSFTSFPFFIANSSLFSGPSLSAMLISPNICYMSYLYTSKALSSSPILALILLYCVWLLIDNREPCPTGPWLPDKSPPPLDHGSDTRDVFKDFITIANPHYLSCIRCSVNIIEWIQEILTQTRTYP